MSSDLSPPFRFLDLPPEIREKIYILLVTSQHSINLSPTHLYTPSFDGPRDASRPLVELDPSSAEPLYSTYPSSFLLSCAQIHQELSPVYFTHNTFTLTIRKHNDNYSTFLSPSSSFRPNLLSIRKLQLIVLRFGSKNYFAGTLVPILEECILNGKLRILEVWVQDGTSISRGRRGYEVGGGMGGRNGGMSAEYDNWGLLRRLCNDPWLERVSLKAGMLEERNGEILQSYMGCKSVPSM